MVFPVIVLTKMSIFCALRGSIAKDKTLEIRGLKIYVVPFTEGLCAQRGGEWCDKEGPGISSQRLLGNRSIATTGAPHTSSQNSKADNTSISTGVYYAVPAFKA